MGQNHLRIYAMLKNVELVGLVEPVEERAKAAAEKYRCRVFAGIEDLVGIVDAVSVAAPSCVHAEIAAFLLDNGIHCLVEKPLATTEADCLALISTAEKSGARLLVGHVERFNPAVRRLSEIMNGGHRIYAMDVRRMSWASARINDMDVVTDLMVHDLDVVLSLVANPVSDVSAHGINILGSEGTDHVVATLSFCNGILATLTASRITQNRIRELTATTDIGHIHLDYGRQELAIYRGPDLAPPRLLSPEPGGTVFDYAMERVLVRSTEPLMAELQHFVDVVKGEQELLVTGWDALQALRVAWRINEATSEQMPQATDVASVTLP
ncbi:MAG: Gfo/Idh/MocA family oxidoreductase [Betaproteobacteria bacterium]|nr:MAG: Gfo/Idh/MocA family oxidoreductase [Betaproteobacteria bacterium]